MIRRALVPRSMASRTPRLTGRLARQGTHVITPMSYSTTSSLDLFTVCAAVQPGNALAYAAALVAFFLVALVVRRFS